jgi:hypothetical protein
VFGWEGKKLLKSCFFISKELFPVDMYRFDVSVVEEKNFFWKKASKNF